MNGLLLQPSKTPVMRKRAAGPTTMAAEARQRVQAWLDRERKLSEALTAARPGARSSAGRPMSQNGKRRSLKEGAVTRSRNCSPPPRSRWAEDHPPSATRRDELFRCDNCHSAANFTAITEQFFRRVWELPPRQFGRCFTILLMLKTSLGPEIGGSVMAPLSDTNTLYVLTCSLAGTVLSLAATWIVVAHSFVQPMVA